MAGVKHFYVGEYIEGSTPGDPSEYYKLVWEAQQAFKNYFASEKEETDAEIMFVQNYTNYNTGYDEVPLSIGTRTGDRRDTYGGMPRYCQNLVYTSLAWERHRGTMTFAHRNYYHAPINISPVDLDHGTITVRGISFAHNNASSGNHGSSACNYLSASAETTVIPIVFENCRFGFYGYCGGACMNFSQHNKAIHTFNGEALVICKSCAFEGMGSNTTNGKCLYVVPPSYGATQPFFVGYNCVLHANMTGQTGGPVSTGTPANITAHDALAFGLYNSYICCDMYQGIWRTANLSANCEFINCVFADKLYYDNYGMKFNPTSADGYKIEYNTSFTTSEHHPTLKNCTMIGSSFTRGSQASLVNVINCQTSVNPKPIYTEATYKIVFGAPTNPNNGYWLTGANSWNAGNTTRMIYCNPTTYPNGEYHKLVYFGTPIKGGKLDDKGSMEVFTDPRILGYFGTSYPNFLNEPKIHRGYSNAINSTYPTDVLDDEWYDEYKRFRGSSVDIGMVEYVPYYISLSVSPEYTGDEEDFGTFKFNTIQDAIDHYIQTHQGIDYTGCKIVVEQDMEVPQIKFNDDRLISASTQMFVICGRRAEPYVDNPQIKLTCSGASMFEFESTGEGSIPDGLEFRDIEFISSGVSNVIKVGEDSASKLLFQRCKFTATGKNTTQAFISGTLNGSYPQNSPSRIIVDNCAFEGKAVDFRTDGSGSNIAFVNTTFMGNKTGKTAEVSVTNSVQRFINCGFWRCEKPVDGTFEMINTWLFNCPEQDWKAASKLTNCATDLSSFGQATASNCKYDLNPDEQFYSYGKYGLLKFFPKEGSDLTTGATTDVLKDFSIYVYGGLAPEQYNPIGTGRPLR